jgi:hypothetical protein
MTPLRRKCFGNGVSSSYNHVKRKPTQTQQNSGSEHTILLIYPLQKCIVFEAKRRLLIHQTTITQRHLLLSQMSPVRTTVSTVI